MTPLFPHRLIVDENIPFAQEAFAPFGEVTTRPGRDLCRDDLLEADADILVVRSVTKVTRAMIEGTRVGFVGTATTGDDHIDRAAMDDLEVTVGVAAGCNANAVVQWVMAALVCLGARRTEAGCAGAGAAAWQGKTLGIVGLGRIGGRVASAASVALGMKVVACDPPKARLDPAGDFVDLDNLIAAADVVSLHVPLSHGGPDATHHLFDAARLRRLREGALLLNPARGQVVDNAALREVLGERPDLVAAFDVFEHEPYADPLVMRRLAIATPHIAGYSLEGKLNGTTMMRDAVARHATRLARRRDRAAPPPAIPAWEPPVGPPDDARIALSPGAPWGEQVAAAILHTYPIAADDEHFRGGPQCDPGAWKAHFDMLRRTYPERREFSAYSIDATGAAPTTLDRLGALGFSILRDGAA
jgi:erythronate-4-phosphate dehydrogenase